MGSFKSTTMKKTTIYGLAAGLFTLAATGQDSKKEQDIRAIKDMCGCGESFSV